MIYLVRLLLFLIRLPLYYVLGLVRFFTKPGSRIIVPLVLAMFVFLNRITWNKAASGADWWLYDGLAVVAVLIAAWVYSLLSRGLNLIFGTFPMPMRPMAPQRRLKPTQTIIKPAVVRVVVPRLPRRRAEKPAMRPLPEPGE